MARNVKSVAYYLQYLNIEIQIDGFGAWCKEFALFRDARDFDMCSQLIAFARTAHLEQECLEHLSFYEVELGLAQDRVRDAIQLLRRLSQGTRNANVSVMALYRLADLERANGQYEDALSDYAAALNLARISDDKATLPYLYHMMGVVHWAKLDLTDAIDLYQRSLDHYRDLYDHWTEDDTASSNIVLGRNDVLRHIGNVLRDLGDAHRKIGDLESAGTYFEESLEIETRIGAGFESALTLISLGKLFRERRMLLEARQSYERALELIQALQSPRFETEVLYRLAETTYLLGAHSQAKSWAEKALASANAYHFLQQESRSLLFLGLSYLALGNVHECVAALSSAVRCAASFDPTLLEVIVSKLQNALMSIDALDPQLADSLRCEIKTLRHVLEE